MIQPTIIAHLYNEAYLLPFWLRHHLPLARLADGDAVDFDFSPGADHRRESCPLLRWVLLRVPLLRISHTPDVAELREILRACVGRACVGSDERVRAVARSMHEARAQRERTLRDVLQRAVGRT